MPTKYKCNIEQPVINARLWREEIPVLDAAAKAAGVSRCEFIARAVRKAAGLVHPSPNHPHYKR